MENFDKPISMPIENNMEIIGCQIKMVDTILHSDISLGTLKYGSGNNGFDKKTEGGFSF